MLAVVQSCGLNSMALFYRHLVVLKTDKEREVFICRVASIFLGALVAGSSSVSAHHGDVVDHVEDETGGVLPGVSVEQRNSCLCCCRAEMHIPLRRGQMGMTG